MKTSKVGYLLAGGVFVVLVAVLAAPYVSARFKSVEPLSEREMSNGDLPGYQFTPDTLRIEDLGIEAPVIYVDQKTEAVYQEALQDGVVHYPGTALPGQPGNTYIFGHSSDYVWSPGDYKTIFAKLPQIEIGTEIEITDASGARFFYEVIETKVVWPRDLSVLDQFNNERYLLTLQTSYPLGTALQRYIVVAELKQD
jgi:LPXTG-site transpeptidase (sortase) family protein